MVHCRVAPGPGHEVTLVGQSQGTGGACGVFSSAAQREITSVALPVERQPRLCL